MKKLINNPDNLVRELLEGYTLAYPEKVKLEGDDFVMRAYPKQSGKVALVTTKISEYFVELAESDLNDLYE